MSHPEQMDEEGMAARLGLKPLARVNQQDRDLGLRGAGDQVAGVLCVAGRVGDDEASRLGSEIAPGDVDGDALLALGR